MGDDSLILAQNICEYSLGKKVPKAFPDHLFFPSVKMALCPWRRVNSDSSTKNKNKTKKKVLSAPKLSRGWIAGSDLVTDCGAQNGRRHEE